MSAPITHSHIHEVICVTFDRTIIRNQGREISREINLPSNVTSRASTDDNVNTQTTKRKPTTLLHQRTCDRACTEQKVKTEGVTTGNTATVLLLILLLLTFALSRLLRKDEVKVTLGVATPARLVAEVHSGAAAARRAVEK